MLGRRVASTALLVPRPFGGRADSVGGQLRGDEERPFNGVTNSGRVWRKGMPESDAPECAGKVVRCGLQSVTPLKAVT